MVLWSISLLVEVPISPTKLLQAWYIKEEEGFQQSWPHIAPPFLAIQAFHVCPSFPKVIISKSLHLFEYPSPHLCEGAHDVCSVHQGGCGHDHSGDHTSLACIACYNDCQGVRSGTADIIFSIVIIGPSAQVLKFLDLFLISLHCKAKIGKEQRKLMICDK